MRVNQSDMCEAGIFAVSLQKACDEMLAGEPMSTALSENDISKNTFITLIKGLRKPGSHDMPDKEHMEALRHPAWQDELAYDICGDDSVYVPPDFEEALHDAEEKYLDQEETAVIESYYKKGMTVRQAARFAGIDDSNAGNKKNMALAELRKHKDELFAGKKFMDRYHELKEAYDRQADGIRWMDEAIGFLKRMDKDGDNDFTGQDGLPDEAREFYTANGFRKISDIYGASPEELVKKIYDFATERAMVKNDAFSLDDKLADLEFPEETLEAFEDAGLITVDDALSLSEDEAAALPRAGRKGIMRLYKTALRSRDGI